MPSHRIAPSWAIAVGMLWISSAPMVFSAPGAAAAERWDLAVAPLRNLRKAEGITREGTGLARYVERDLRVLRPEVTCASRGRIYECLEGNTSFDPTRIVPREMKDLARCLGASELVWGTYGFYEERTTIFLDHWVESAAAHRHDEVTGRAGETFAIIDRLILGIAAREGWKVTQEIEKTLADRETDSFPAYLDYWEGREAYARSQYPEALGKFRAAAAADPKYLWARLFVSNVLFRQGDLQAAEAGFRTLTEEHPDFLPAFINLGAALKARGKPRAAIRVYKHAPDWEDSPPLLFNLGNAYGALAQDTEIRNAYEAAVRLAPEFADPYYHLALFYGARDVVDRSRENALRARYLRPELTMDVYKLGLPLRDILIEHESEYQAPLDFAAVRLERPGKEPSE